MRMNSQICGTNSNRHSSLVAHPRQLVVFSPSTRVADGDRRLRHQALLVEIRHRALIKGFPCSAILFCYIVAYTLACTLGFQSTFSLAHKHLPLVAVELSAMAAVSTCCMWSSP